jgi:hypothetical protein
MTMATAEPRSTADGHHLPAARNRLENAISKVIDPKPQYADNRVHWLDSLYSQVQAAVLAMRKGSSTHAFGSQPPGWIDAMDLLRDIDRQAAGWEPSWHLYPYRLSVDTPTATVLRLNTIERRRWRPQDVSAIDDISAWLERWAKRVDKLLTAEPVKHIPAPCPACETQWVYRVDDVGERVRQPALQITTLGCTCMNCNHTWAPEYFTHLARVLGCELPAGVLE